MAWDRPEPPAGRSFVPWDAMQMAADKRLQAQAFRQAAVSIPRTELLADQSALQELLSSNRSCEWALKYPVACGGAGHRLVTADSAIREDWPLPFVLQEFIRLPQPEVYRVYCVDGELFGWNARRYPPGVKASPWVAHAQGARYVHLGTPPAEAAAVATAALKATGLFGSFGIVDLLSHEDRWLVLEIGSDGLFNHVDRDFDNPALALELERRLAEAFWKPIGPPPWKGTAWHPQAWQL